MLGTQMMPTLLDLAAGWMVGSSAEMREKWRGTVWLWAGFGTGEEKTSSVSNAAPDGCAGVAAGLKQLC